MAAPLSRYNQIAIDIAKSIIEGKYGSGEKLAAMYEFADLFNTSFETVRRAMNILEDVGIVRVVHGRGVFVVSVEKASDFLENYQNVNASKKMTSELLASAKRQQRELEKTTRLIKDLEHQTKRRYYAFPFSPHEITIDEECVCRGMNLAELQIWNRTGVTVIAIKRNDEYIVAPGPRDEFLEGDIVYFIGDKGSGKKFEDILWSEYK